MQVPLLVLEHTLAKALYQYYWTMLDAVEQSQGWQAARIPLILLIAATEMMLE